MDAAARPLSSSHAALPAWDEEVARKLRAAAMDGDDPCVARLLSDLLRFKASTRGHTIALQLQTLMCVITSLRSVALTDDLTGLYNRRGFLQIGTRLLEVARRELQSAWLVYFDLDGLKHVNDTAGHAAGDVLLRQTGNFLRDLFPSYGACAVLGRLGGDEFAALTMDATCPTNNEILLRGRRSQAGSPDARPLSLSMGAAHFSPRCPAEIADLLKNAEQAMYEQKRATPKSRPPGLPPTGSGRVVNGLGGGNRMSGA